MISQDSDKCLSPGGQLWAKSTWVCTSACSGKRIEGFFFPYPGISSLFDKDASRTLINAVRLHLLKQLLWYILRLGRQALLKQVSVIIPVLTPGLLAYVIFTASYAPLPPSSLLA